MSDYASARVCIVDSEDCGAQVGIRVRRTFMVLGLALILTMPAVVRAQSPQPLQSLPQSVPAQDNVLARVNGAEVRQSDVLRMLDQLPAEVRNMPQGQLFTLLIERAVDRVLVIEAARADGLANDPEVRARLKQAEDDLLWATFLERKVAEGMTDSRIRKAYDRLAGEAAEEEIKARHILLASEDEAKAIIRDLEGGADFQAIAREKSIGPSRETGGDLGFFNRGQMVLDFSDAAFALDVGDYSKTPVKTQFGWHVILVEERRRSEVPSMPHAMPKIQQEVTRQVLTEVLGGLRKGAEIEIVGAGGGLQRPGQR
ncbi:MAG: peptidylprolyl isomerase [Alphaproteobacteria bacterium]|nr:peptidylprolyl isomerase [Alphaproteobacteria bacterium]